MGFINPRSRVRISPLVQNWHIQKYLLSHHMLQVCHLHQNVCALHTTRSGTLDELATAPAFQATQCITMEQPHRAAFEVVFQPSELYRSAVDATITTQKGLTLVVKHADCLPILVYHPKGVIAAIHAGRRSTQQHITKKVLRYIRAHFAAQDQIYLWFGPALCASCHTLNQDKTLHYDLYRQNRLQAESVFSSEKIILSTNDTCTAHTPNAFYSYRGDGPGVAMNYSAITLR